jgi:hypothetical protein
MEDELILSEKDRAKLDGIVQRMSFNKESDDAIQFVVNDFKKKYGVKKKNKPYLHKSLHRPSRNLRLLNYPPSLRQKLHLHVSL